jgi:hypothetical protein
VARDRRNRYSEPAGDNRGQQEGRYPAPAVIPERSAGEWPNRPTPAVVSWEPQPPTNWLERWEAKKLQRSFDIATDVVRAGTRLYRASEELEHARQDLELAHAKRASLPIRILNERLMFERELAKGLGALEAARADLESQRSWRSRQKWLDDQDFQIQILRREAERRELEARIAAASAQAITAAEIGRNQGEADLHKAHEAALRAQVSAERERNRRDEERDRRKASEPAVLDDMPEHLRRHYATQREVNRTYADARHRAQAIRDLAAAQGRDSTSDEMEAIDALEDAAAAAEDSIRRGDASDL